MLDCSLLNIGLLECLLLRIGWLELWCLKLCLLENCLTHDCLDLELRNTNYSCLKKNRSSNILLIYISGAIRTFRSYCDKYCTGVDRVDILCHLAMLINSLFRILCSEIKRGYTVRQNPSCKRKFDHTLRIL